MGANGRRILFVFLTALLCLTVLAAGIALSYSYFSRGMNLREVDMKKYIKVEMEDQTYIPSVDADGIVRDFHLPNPKDTTLDLSLYPDVATIYSLRFMVTPQEAGGWTIEVGSERLTASEDLRKGGLKLVNTKWVWTEQDLKNAYRAGLEYPRKLSMKKYVLCTKNSQGEYVLTVDHERLLRATGWDLPDEETRKEHTGYQAIMSLGFLPEQQEDGTFVVHACSTLEDVQDILEKNEVQLTDVTWTYTLAEVEELYETQRRAAQEAAQKKQRQLSMKEYALCGKDSQGGYMLAVDYDRLLADCGWDLPADETARSADSGYRAVKSLGYYVQPQGEGFLVQINSNMSDVYALLLENGVKLMDTSWTCTAAEMERLYEEHRIENPAPQAEAPQPAGPVPLTSLYRVDQTPARQAIRQAKEQRYGNRFKSSEITANYFFVAQSDAAQHRNCFRIVYTVTTTGGKEYLVADLYDLVAGTLPTAAEVQLSVKKSAAEAGRTDDFDPDLYTVYPLSDGAMAYSEDSGVSPFNGDGLLFPNSLTQKINDSEVWTLSIPGDKTLLQLLGYGRNEIFARCGNKFSNTSEYTKFYSNYGWYQPKGSVSFDTIKKKYPVAAENIEFLKAMEQLIKEG